MHSYHRDMNSEPWRDRRVLLSSMWIFVMLNYLYADVMGLMDPALAANWHTGEFDGLRMTPTLMFGAAVMMEVPIAMTVLARLLPFRVNRVANVVAALFKTVAVVATLLVGSTAAYYAFFATIEVATTLAIAVLAWRWREV